MKLIITCIPTGQYYKCGAGAAVVANSQSGQSIGAQR